MPETILIDPITRIEGHLAIKVETENNHVTKAYCAGEMFRGFENILRGRDPLDAQQVTQRICGVCPISHGIASILAQDDAYGITLPTNGRLVRNLIQGANFIQSHIIHFYQLSALDFVDITAAVSYSGNDPMLVDLKNWVNRQLNSNSLYPAAPFLPRWDAKYIDCQDANIQAIKNYLTALDMRQVAHQMAALFCGKIPHATALVPGGVTEKVTATKIVAYKSKLKKLQTFIDTCYLPDILNVASAFPEHFATGKGCNNFMAYGVFPEDNANSGYMFPSGILKQGALKPFDRNRIAEDIRFSHFSSPSGLHPSKGETEANPSKSESYSWLKAPRYGGDVMEVGPLARILIAYHNGAYPGVNKLVDAVLAQANLTPNQLVSTLGRHAARAIECKLVADRCAEWIDMITPDKPTFTEFSIPSECTGAGLCEAPRGALGHWIDIQKGKIANYQCVVPTTWNCSPRDEKGIPGPVEQALMGAPVLDSDNPMEVARIVRAFDPCIACAVH